MIANLVSFALRQRFLIVIAAIALRHRGAAELASDDEQRGCSHERQARGGEVRPPTARDDRGHVRSRRLAVALQGSGIERGDRPVAAECEPRSLLAKSAKRVSGLSALVSDHFLGPATIVDRVVRLHGSDDAKLCEARVVLGMKMLHVFDARGRARDKTLNLVGKLPAQGPDMKVLTKGPAYARRHAV